MVPDTCSPCSSRPQTMLECLCLHRRACESGYPSRGVGCSLHEAEGIAVRIQSVRPWVVQIHARAAAACRRTPRRRLLILIPQRRQTPAAVRKNAKESRLGIKESERLTRQRAASEARNRDLASRSSSG